MSGQEITTLVKGTLDYLFMEYIGVIRLFSGGQTLGIQSEVAIDSSCGDEIWKDFNSFKSQRNLLYSKSKVTMHLKEDVEPRTLGFDILC